MSATPKTPDDWTDVRVHAIDASCFWEEASVDHAGAKHTAGGGFVNHMALVGYPTPTDAVSGIVTTFSGDVVLGRYFVTSRYKQWNPLSRHHEEMVCYRVITPDRRVFSGRNGGAHMLLRMRRSLTLTNDLRKRLRLPQDDSCA